MRFEDERKLGFRKRENQKDDGEREREERNQERERESLSENTCEMGSFVIIKRNLGTWKEKKSNGGIFVGVRKSDKDDCKCNRPLLFYFCFLHIWSRIILDFKISWFGR